MSVSLFELYNLLPRTNCKKCGTVCMGFAAKLISGEAKPEDCPLLLEPAYNDNLETLKNILSPFTEKGLTGLIIAAENCMGCGICVVVCEENRMNEEVIYGKGGRHKDVQVLRIECGKVRLVDAKKCKRAFEPPEFCRACVDHCPTNAIELVS